MRAFVILALSLCLLESSLCQERRRTRVRVKGRRRNNFGAAAAAAAPAAPVRQRNEPTAAAANTCPEDGLLIAADPDSCNHFYKCANGTLTHETCGNGLLFNEDKAFVGAVHNHCSYNWNTQCGDRLLDETAIASPGCPYEFGLFPVQSCYPSYFKCAYGEPEEIPCDVGLIYDNRIHTCNYPDLLIEEEGCNPSQLLGGFVCPDQSELTAIEARYYPFPRFSVPDQPNLYIICVDNLPRLKRCPQPTEFDPTTLTCVEF